MHPKYTYSTLSIHSFCIFVVYLTETRTISSRSSEWTISCHLFCIASRTDDNLSQPTFVAPLNTEADLLAPLRALEQGSTTLVLVISLWVRATQNKKSCFLRFYHQVVWLKKVFQMPNVPNGNSICKSTPIRIPLTCRRLCRFLVVPQLELEYLT